MKKISSFDFLGNIAIVNFPLDLKLKDKKKLAEDLMKKNKSIKTVLEKSGKVKGRLRKPETKYVAGDKTKEVLYKENNCMFRFNVDTTYFSPRLSNERKEISQLIKKNENVLVMFAGVAPFSIVIAKNSKAKKVYSNEINREANKYAKRNIEINKLKDKVELISGDIKRIVKTWEDLPSQTHNVNIKSVKSKRSSIANQKKYLLNRSSAESRDKVRLGASSIPKFECIVMPRPQLKDTFLNEAFKLSKKGTRIYYYDFCKKDEIDQIIDKIKQDAKKSKKKIKILKKKIAGEIAPYKVRVRIDLKVV